MNSPPNFFLIGPMGAGKSTIGRYLSHALQRDFYDSDKEIEQSTGVSVSWIFDVEGEIGFRNREEAIIDTLSQLSPIILSTGGGAVLSSDTQARLPARGTVIYLQVSHEQQYERVMRNQNRPLLQTPNVRETLIRLQTERNPIYESIAHWVFCTDHQAAADIAETILERIKREK